MFKCFFLWLVSVRQHNYPHIINTMERALLSSCWSSGVSGVFVLDPEEELSLRGPCVAGARGAGGGRSGAVQVPQAHADILGRTEHPRQGK